MQKLKFPMEYLRVTQGYGYNSDGTVNTNSYSHAGTYAMDFGGKDSGADKLYCPCDMIVKRLRYKATGECYMESTLPVEFADGSTDYVHLLFIHDSSFNVVEGQVVKQGEYFYDEGGMGSGKPNKFSTHVHIEGGKGKWKSCTQTKNSSGVYASENQFPLHKMFILGDDVQILNDGGYDWKRASALTNKEENKDNNFVYGVDVSHNRSKDIMKKIVANGKAEFVIYRSAVGSSSVDEHLAQFIKDSGDLKVGFFPANYFGSVQDAIEEADYTINTIEDFGFTPDKLSLPVFCDWEGFSYDYQAKLGNIVTPAKLREMTVAFCERIKSRGYKTGVYLNKNYWDNWYGQAFFDRHPDYYIWYARPGVDKPDKDCYLWQYACNEGTEYGVNEPLDKNILIGNYIVNNKNIWASSDKYLEVTGKNCEYFDEVDINTPRGYLAKDTVYKIKRITSESVSGFNWAEIIFENKETAFVVLLDDRCTLIDEPNLFETEINSLKKEKQELINSLENAQIIISEKDKLISSLEEENYALDKSIAIYQEANAKLKSELEQLSNQEAYNEIIAERDYYKRKAERLEQQISSNHKELSAFATALERLLNWLKGVG